MAVLLNLAHWVDRIQAQCPVFESRVYRTIPDDELNIDQHESPVAFVYEQEYQAQPSALVGTIRQLATPLVTIEIAVRRTASASDRFNEAAMLDLQSCRAELLTALMGWVPDDCMFEVQARDGNHRVQNKTLRSKDTFSMTFYLNNG